MTYLESLQGALQAVIKAAEQGRQQADGMLEPMTQAVGHVQEAAAELEALPWVGPFLGARLQRSLRALESAKQRVNKVVARYDQGLDTVRKVRDRIQAFGRHLDKAGAAARRVFGELSTAGRGVLDRLGLGRETAPGPEAITPFPHLLVLQPLSGTASPYYFNLDTAAFDHLRRQTRFNWASQERLSRDNAQQAVGLGEESLSLQGTLYPGFRGGLGQLQTLRSLGRQLNPLSLTTGYGEVLGTFCLTRIEEDQSALMAGGIPRKQQFTLEFVSYGQDLRNL